MLLYRVYRYLPGAKSGENGHHDFLYRPQGRGRWDNPHLYDAWYLSSTPEGAVGEVLGDLAVWTRAVVEPAAFRRGLGTYQTADSTPLLDLDDALALHERGLRPSQVVRRNRPMTQDIAKRAFVETDAFGARKWAGISWWSLRWAPWRPVCLWVPETERSPLTHLTTEVLTLDHPAVEDAARTLAKKLG